VKVFIDAVFDRACDVIIHLPALSTVQTRSKFDGAVMDDYQSKRQRMMLLD
jgi:hypothetical protein